MLGVGRRAITVIIIQWVLIIRLLFWASEHKSAELQEVYTFLQPHDWDLEMAAEPVYSTKTNKTAIDEARVKFPGVALAVLVKRPTWYTQQRYTVMVHNALANIPQDWAVQLMVEPGFWNATILSQHAFFQRSHRRIILTPLPEHLGRQAAHLVLKDDWYGRMLQVGMHWLFTVMVFCVVVLNTLSKILCTWTVLGFLGDRLVAVVGMVFRCSCVPGRPCWLYLRLQIAVKATDRTISLY